MRIACLCGPSSVIGGCLAKQRSDLAPGLVCGGAGRYSKYDMATPRAPNAEDALPELVRRITNAVHPRRIILFGSAARGQMSPHSDLDVLVVLSDGVDPVAAELEIYRSLWGLRFGADVIAVTERDVERFRSNPSLVIHTALTEGRELYRAVG